MIHRLLTVRLSFLLFAICAVLTLASSAKADTYNVFTARYTQSENFVAANDYGDYTINVTDLYANNINGPCGFNASHCYLTHYADTGADVYTTTVPVLRFDPFPAAGAGCNIVKTGFEVSRDLCVNGHELFFATFYTSAFSGIRGLFNGPDPLTNLLTTGSYDGGIMTANGSLFYIDGVNNALKVALNVTPAAAVTPEPSSLLLLGTGMLGAVAALRRRLFA